MPFFNLFDPMYWLIVGPTLLLAGWASIRVKSTFNRYAKVGVRSGMTGAQAAAQVARAGGLDATISPTAGSVTAGENGVVIEATRGFLSDHYDPRTRTLRLSPQVFEGRSISAIAVAAHEAGHALRHSHDYAMLTVRSKLVPITMIGSNLWLWVFFGGLLMHYQPLMLVGIVLLAFTVVFQLVTLPVEFDASRRAKLVLASTGIVSTQEEALGVEKVLGAAALTYVAGALTAVATLLYYVSIFMGRRD
jgi:Zn-dependent membrane protease YugP